MRPILVDCLFNLVVAPWGKVIAALGSRRIEVSTRPPG